ADVDADAVESPPSSKYLACMTPEVGWRRQRSPPRGSCPCLAIGTVERRRACRRRDLPAASPWSQKARRLMQEPVGRARSTGAALAPSRRQAALAIGSG